MQNQNSLSQFTEHSQNFKALIQVINTYEFSQLKLYLSNLQKKIHDKVDQFHSQFGSLTSLLNNTKQGKGKTALHYACARGNVDIVKYLIEQFNADYTYKDKEGNNMFFTSVSHNMMNLVKYFVQGLHVSVNSVKQGEIVALHIAGMNNNVQMITYLLEKGADIQKMSIHGKPINWAIGCQAKQAIFKLLQHGANPDGDTTSIIPPPIIIAIDFELVDIYNALIKHNCSLQVKDPNGYSVLHLAAEKGNLQVVKDLLERGLNKYINQQVQGKTPLYLAFQKGKWDVVCFLRDLTHNAQLIEAKVKTKQQLKINQTEQINISKEKKQEAQVLKNQGNKSYTQKKYQQALQLYNKSSNIDPTNQVVERNKAACYLALEKYQQALESCQKAKKKCPKNTKTLYRQAQAYFGLKNYVQGAGSLWQCVMLEPKNNFFQSQFNKYIQFGKKQHKIIKNKQQTQ